MLPLLHSRMFLATLLAASGILVCGLAGCGGSSDMIAPVVLTVSLSNATIDLAQGGTALAPVIVNAPTEAVTFTITGLPAGVSQVYKESESNPSGLLTLTANTAAPIGSYKPTIVVGSSGQTASFAFTLVVTAPAPVANAVNAGSLRFVARP
jgi:hypothetical protein